MRRCTIGLTAAAVVAGAMASAGPAAAGAPTCTVAQLTSVASQATPNDTRVAEISDDGTVIAFESSRNVNGGNPEGNDEVWVHRTSTGTSTQITSTTSSFSGTNTPVISGDGSRIVFVSQWNPTGGNADMSPELFTYDVASSNVVQRTNTTGFPWLEQPTVNQDGNRIAFVSDIDPLGSNSGNDKNVELFLLDTTSSTFSQLTTTTGSVAGATDPSISDDGTRIAFQSANSFGGTNPGSSADIFLHDTSTGVRTPITSSTTGRSGSADISGDGTRIAFTSTLDLTGSNPEGADEVFLRVISTGNTTQVTNAAGIARFPDVDADGTRIAFLSGSDIGGQNPDGNHEIWVHDTELGTTFPATTSTGSAVPHIPSINADGTKVALQTGKNMVGQNADGTDEVFVATCGAGSPAPPRPDGLIRRGTSEAFLGNGVYNLNAQGQTRTVSAARGVTVTFAIRVQNDGSTPTTLRVQGAAGSSTAYQATYFSGSTDITSRVVAGTQSFANVPPGGTRTIQLRIKVKQGATAGSSLARSVTVRSTDDLTVRDVVKAVVRRA